jgi:hypothetical protein
LRSKAPKRADPTVAEGTRSTVPKGARSPHGGARLGLGWTFSSLGAFVSVLRSGEGAEASMLGLAGLFMISKYFFGRFFWWGHDGIGCWLQVIFYVFPCWITTCWCSSKVRVGRLSSSPLLRENQICLYALNDGVLGAGSAVGVQWDGAVSLQCSDAGAEAGDGYNGGWEPEDERRWAHDVVFS